MGCLPTRLSRSKSNNSDPPSPSSKSNDEKLNDSRRITSEKPIPEWSLTEETNFSTLYRKSDIVDKKIFLNSAFIYNDISMVDVSPRRISVETEPMQLSPIEATFDITSSVNDNQICLTPVDLDPLNAAHLRLRPSPISVESPDRPLAFQPSPLTTSGYRTMVVSSQDVSDQITTFITDTHTDKTNNFFSFDNINSEDIIFASSFIKRDFIADL